jgi:hypothetical protein
VHVDEDDNIAFDNSGQAFEADIDRITDVEEEGITEEEEEQ